LATLAVLRGRRAPRQSSVRKIRSPPTPWRIRSPSNRARGDLALPTRPRPGPQKTVSNENSVTPTLPSLTPSRGTYKYSCGTQRYNTLPNRRVLNADIAHSSSSSRELFVAPLRVRTSFQRAKNRGLSPANDSTLRIITSRANAETRIGGHDVLLGGASHELAHRPRMRALTRNLATLAVRRDLAVTALPVIPRCHNLYDTSRTP